jgi:hypothetical protein
VSLMPFIVVALFFGIAGLVLRRVWLLPLPIVVFSIWMSHAYKGEGDDVTGPVFTVLMISGFLAMTVGTLLGKLAHYAIFERSAPAKQPAPPEW